MLSPVADRLAVAVATTSQHLKAFEAVESGEAAFDTVMNALTEHTDRLVSSQALAKEIQQIAQDIPDEEDALAALVIAADISTHGFGMGEVHLRINAAQIRNAMRPVDGRTISVSDGVSSPRLLIERLALRIRRSLLGISVSRALMARRRQQGDSLCWQHNFLNI